jgi:hypothetical protein
MDTPAQIHIMLVSEQAAPNLLPALDPALKPKEAVLLVSKKMTKRADALQSVLQESGIKPIRISLADEHNLQALEEAIMNTAEILDGKSIAVNLTGGNKLMALAAQSVAQAAGWPVFYVDVDTDQIVWLDKTLPPQSLTQQLRLPHYLRGYGYKLEANIERPLPNALWQTLINDLVLNVGSLSAAIGKLNYLAQQTGHGLKVHLSNEELDSRSLEALLRKFEQAQLLQLEGSNLQFQSESAKTFASGGWLEHYVYQTVCQITGKLEIRDKAANLKVIDPIGQNNEIDVAFLARNRLFMIECKTSRMDNIHSTKANDALYKLSENCRRIGGSSAKGMFVTYRNFYKDKDGKYPEKRLAEAIGIKTVSCEQLQSLDRHIKEWVRPAA